MTRWPAVLSLAAFMTGCAGHPAPAPDPAPADVALEAPDDSASGPALPLVLSAEDRAELAVAADSAADAEILERLDAAAPADSSESEDSPGGANAAGVDEATWDIDVQTFTNHARVQYYLSFFQGPARERFTVWLSRMPKYETMIRQRLAEQGLPEDMIYLALIESGFSNTAVSRARATGMWQFMKGTAKLYGLRVDNWVDERRDPYLATEAAAHHLRDLRDRFGSMYLAAAAYNAGAGRVTRGLARMGEDDDDSLTDSVFFRLYDTRHLRRETKDYVPKLIAAALIAKEPERYGFPPIPEPMETPVWDSLVVTDATGLDVVARLADTSLSAIRDMNPKFLRLATPPHSRSVIRIPVGRGPEVTAEYAALPARERVSFQEHFVKRGETLSHIAVRYHVTVTELRQANPGLRTLLRIGQRIVIPTAGVSVARSAAAAETRRVAVRRSATATSHLVGRGETLSGIADRYDVTVRDLQEWNDLPGTTIRAGQRLRVRGAATAAPSSSAGGSTVYVVRAGDTLSTVAQRYGVSISALQAANGLGRSSLIKVGAKLRIPG
ncbi:MAG: LysM peptidoglycan-binding domain-containing protein [Gemmatimonadales bacterium]